MRRSFEKSIRYAVSAITLLSMGLAVPSVSHAQSNEVVVGVFGGTTADFMRSVMDDYAAKNGLTVIYQEGNSTQLLAQAQAQAGQPQMDAILANDQTFEILKREGLADKLKPELVTELANVLPEYRDPDGYGQSYGSSPYGFMYRKAEIEAADIDMGSWNSLFDKKLAKKVVLLPPPGTYGMTTLLGLTTIGGGDVANTEPGFAKLEELLPNVLTTVRAAGQAEDLLTRGEAWVTIASASRAETLATEGAPVTFSVPKEGTMVIMNFLVPLKGAKNADGAQKLVNHMLTTEVQTRIANELVRMPVRGDVLPEQKAQAALGYVDGKAPKGWLVNMNDIIKVMPQWVDSWNRILANI